MQIVGPLGEPDLRFSAQVLAEFMNGGVRRLLEDNRAIGSIDEAQDCP